MPKRPLWLPFALLLAAAAPAPNAPPANPVDAARAEEQRLTEARIAAAAKLRDTDLAVADAANQVAALTERRQAAEQKLRERAAALGPLLPLAERLGLFPAETLLAVPAAPEQSIRGLAVLHGLMRTVERQAAELRRELAQVEDAQRALDAALPRLRVAQAEQTLQGDRLDRQLIVARANRALAEDAAAESARRAAAEATRADTVHAAIAMMDAAHARTQLQLEQDAERAERQRRDAALAIARRRQAEVAAPAGPGLQSGTALALPVAGPVIRRWGDQTDAGPARGISFRAPPKGRVVAPCTGRVAFAGPFRSYGVLVIIDCGEGFHFVLAGLERLDTEAGAAVREGEPLGMMADWDPTGAAAHPALYVELRRAGHPVDPSPFLRAPFHREGS